MFCLLLLSMNIFWGKFILVFLKIKIKRNNETQHHFNSLYAYIHIGLL